MQNVGTVFYRTSYSNGSYKPSKWASVYSESKLRIGSPCDYANLAAMVGSYSKFQSKDVSSFPSVEFSFKKVMHNRFSRERLIFVAKTKEQYKSVIRLNNEAHRHFFYRVPTVTESLLTQIRDEHEGRLDECYDVMVPISSGDLSSMFLEASVTGDSGSLTKIVDRLNYFREVTGGKAYLLMDMPFHESYFPRQLFSVCAKLVQGGHLKAEDFVYSPIAHFPKDDAEISHRDITYLHQKMKGRPSYPQDSPFMDYEDVSREMAKLDISDEDKETIGEIFKASSEYFDFLFTFKLKDYQMPSIGIPAEEEEIELGRLLVEGWNKRALDFAGFQMVKGKKVPTTRRQFRGEWSAENREVTDIDELFSLGTVRSERLKFEFETIKTMGFIGYFLIVEDVTRHADSKGWERNHAGRGSAAGALISYVLGITGVDPINSPHYDDLLFERFLNPSRVSMPDIDLDFSGLSRDRVIRYLKEKYGRDRVVLIGAYRSQRIKQVLKDLHKAHGYSWPTNERTCDTFHVSDESVDYSIGQINNITRSVEKVKQDGTLDEIIAECVETSTLFRDAYDIHSDMIHGEVKPLCEFMRGDKSNHPSGYLILPATVDECIPIRFTNNDPTRDMISHYEMDECEASGYVKLDCLNVNAVGMMARTAELVKKRTGTPPLSMNEVDLTDPLVIADLTRDSYGIFQFKSEIQRNYLKALNPTSFHHLYDSVALCRTGPMQANAHTDYIDLVQGEKAPDIEHPLMEPSLKSTYGLIIYQEQVMRLAQDMADFTLAEADNLRRAIGKKDPAEMLKYESLFVDGCKKNGIDEELAKQTWEKINFFSGYGFNMCVGPDTLLSFRGFTSEFIHLPIKWVHDAMNIRNLMTPTIFGKTEFSCSLDLQSAKGNLAMRISKCELFRRYGNRETVVCPEGDFWNSEAWQYLCFILENQRYGATFSFDEEARRGVRNDIVDISLLPQKAPSLYIDFDGSMQPIRCSPTHRFTVVDPFTMKMKDVCAAELKLGDALIRADFLGPLLKEGESLGEVNLESSDKYSERVKPVHIYDERYNRDSLGVATHFSRITEISTDGLSDIYEVRMRDPYNRYFSSGVLSHNSHAVSYSLMGFYMAYLKTYFLLEYYCGVLTYSPEDREMSNNIYELKTHIESIGIKVGYPTYKNFRLEYEPTTVDGVDSISWPIHSLSGISKGTAKEIYKASNKGSFESIKDFFDKVPKSALNLRVFKALLYSGFFDASGLEEVERTNQIIARMTERRDKAIKEIEERRKAAVQSGVSEVEALAAYDEELKKVGTIPPYETAKWIAFKQRRDRVVNYYWEVGGRKGAAQERSRQAILDQQKRFSWIFFNSYHAMKVFRWSSKNFFKYDKSTLGTYYDYRDANDRDRVGVGGVITRVREHLQSNDKTMAFVDVEDNGELYNVLVFADGYDLYKAKHGGPLRLNDVIQVVGRKSVTERGESIIVSDESTSITLIAEYEQIMLDPDMQ